MSLLEDEDGAPYPELWAVLNDEGELYVPYPGGDGTGSKAAAERWVRPNAHLGWKAVRCQLVPVMQRYFCPTSGEVEDPASGGFDICCDRPDLHKPVTSLDETVRELGIDERCCPHGPEDHNGTMGCCTALVLDPEGFGDNCPCRGDGR